MLAATRVFAAGPAQTFTGVITDSMCGKSHKAMGVTPDSQCVRDCVRADPSRYKYSLYDGKNVYILSDQQTPARFAAQKVTVKGVLDQNTNTIRVDSIAAGEDFVLDAGFQEAGCPISGTKPTSDAGNRPDRNRRYDES